MDPTQLLNLLTLLGVVSGSGGIIWKLSRLETRMNGTSEDIKKLKANCPIFGNVNEPQRQK